MSVLIQLSEAQKIQAWDEGERRQSENERNGKRGRNKAFARGPNALSLHLYGALGEIAAADYLGLSDYLFQDDQPVRDSCDLPYNIDVKTRRNHSWDLLVQLDDVAEKNYVLVTAQNKTIYLHGWITGAEAMRKEWIREYVKGRPCYSIPQSELRSPESLKEFVQTHAAVPA